MAGLRQFGCVRWRNIKLAEVGSGQQEAVVDDDTKEDGVIWCEVGELMGGSGSGG